LVKFLKAIPTQFLAFLNPTHPVPSLNDRAAVPDSMHSIHHNQTPKFDKNISDVKTEPFKNQWVETK